MNCSLGHAAWINQPCMGDKQTVDWEQIPPVPTEAPWWMGIKERCCHYCCHTASHAGIHGSKGCWNMNCTQVRARIKDLSIRVNVFILGRGLRKLIYLASHKLRLIWLQRMDTLTSKKYCALFKKGIISECWSKRNSNEEVAEILMNFCAHAV